MVKYIENLKKGSNCAFLTGSIGVRSKHITHSPLADKTALYSDSQKLTFHVECQPFWIPFGNSLVTFIVASLPFPSWNLQFITKYRQHRALISTVCLKWLHISTWRVKRLQQRMYTEQNAACLMLTHISSQTFLAAVCWTSVSLTEKSSKQDHITNEKWSTIFKQKWCYNNMKEYICTSREIGMRKSEEWLENEDQVSVLIE